MSKGQVVVASLVILLLLVAACTPKAAPAPQAAPLASAAQAPAPMLSPTQATTAAKAAWETEWEKTLALAKEEGTVSVVLGQSGAILRFPLAEGLKNAYGISVESIVGRGNEAAEKVLRERRAGLYNYDLCMTGSTTALNLFKPAGALGPLEPTLILPDVTDPELIKKTWYQGKLWWVDKEHTLMAPTLRFDFPLAINTNLVKEGEVKSVRDLVNPKWQGKVASTDPTTGGGNLITFLTEMLGWDFVAEFAKAQPIIMRDERLLIDWLAHGKVSIVLKPSPDYLSVFKGTGAPVKGLMPTEGTWLTGGSGNLSGRFANLGSPG